MVVNRRAKGNRAMNEIVKLFQNWWGGEWQRRGGGFTGDDVVTPDGFPFSLEVKDHAHVRLRHLLTPTKDVLSFWQQAKDQAAKLSKTPVLIIKVEQRWLAAYKLDGSVSGDIGIWSSWNGEDILILPLEGFFKDYDRKVHRGIPAPQTDVPGRQGPAVGADSSNVQGAVSAPVRDRSTEPSSRREDSVCTRSNGLD